MVRASSQRGVVFSAAAVLLLSACSRSNPAGQASASPRQSPAVTEGLARARAATARFVSLDSAVAAGYGRDVARCYVDSHHGAMGFHHVNRANVDARVDVERPEILLYERFPDGRYVLNGMEYIVPYRAWPKDSVPPTLLGMPMLQQEELQIWYLHIWAWTDNASGLFADYNPAVRCPAGTEARLQNAN